MKEYHANEIINTVVLGHSGSGKTTIIEALAHRADAVSKMGNVYDGSTISDYDSDEIKRKTSINMSIVPLEWEGKKINLIDAPGNNDFIGERNQALFAGDCALIIVPSATEISIGTINAMNCVQDKPKIIFISGLDDPNNAYLEQLRLLKETFGKTIAPIQVPIIENGVMVGYVNVAKMEGRRFNGKQTDVCEIPANMWDEVNPIKEMIDEAVASSNDELMEKYFNQEPFSKEEISYALRQGVMDKTIIPVLCGSHEIGINILLNSLAAFLPVSSDQCNSFIVNNKDTCKDDIIGYNEELPTSAFIFKTVVDPFIGMISYLKVMSGTLNPNTSLYNSIKDENEKISKLYIPKGKDLIEVEALHAGDIGVVSKLQHTKTNDTLCQIGTNISYEKIIFPTPYYSKAIVPVGNNTEEKITGAIIKLLDEDQTLQFSVNSETKQQLLFGIGDQHLDITASKLKNKYKLDIAFEDVAIPYRETITTKVTKRSKYKKQSGGHGQYGDVEIVFEPANDFNLDYIFEEKIVGGTVPKAYFPAVEKGLQESVKEGVLAKRPVIGIKATLIDGSYHNVDSSEMAFKTATCMAFKEASIAANPVLLEPFMKINIYVTDNHMGDIIGDINKKRGRVLNINHENNNVHIEAVAPLSELLEFAIELKALTQGQGTFDMIQSSYEVVPSSIQKQIIEKIR